MKKLISIVSAVALVAAVSLTAAAPASAQAWRYHRHYHGGYFNPGVGIAAGIVGLAAGAAIANSARNRDYYGDGHVSACYDAYKSYDARSDTYLGYDGYRHRCDL